MATIATTLLPYLLILLLACESSLGAPHQAKKVPNSRVDNINFFLAMAGQVANHIQPNSNCYVCGLMPYTAGEGLPLMALPASDCDTCHLMHIPFFLTYSHSRCNSMTKMRRLDCASGHSNCQKCQKTPKPVSVQLIPKPFPWCIQNDGNTPVGKSTDCIHTFKWDSEITDTVFLKSLHSDPEYCLKTAGRARLSTLARRTASCSISSPEGMYWVCGDLAYPYLPVDYNGRCGLAYVLPAMRVAHSLPEKTTPKRSRRAISNIFLTHHQSPFKNILGPLLPFYGIMSALDQIGDLSRAVEDIANLTSRALMLISSELASVRLLALQNRAALDYLLAAQGGTCAVIGSECCTYVPDYNATINDIVIHLQKVGESVHQDGGTLLDWLKSIFGSSSYFFAKWIGIFVAFIVFMSVFMQCVKRFLCNIGYTPI